ncbi:MAG: ribonuclease III [Planctomycetota bacterium]|nr:MAG: ribonuclease III [Planctomycetota bacterium]
MRDSVPRAVIWPPLEFRDPARLELALTHASFDGRRNNERYELLGDAALSLAVAQELLARLPDASEGELSRRRAWVVSQPVLAAAAVELDLAARARIGAGVDRAHLPARMLASLYEAVLGAIQEDRGHEAVAAFVRATLRGPLETACAERFELDPKQELQEWAQARSLGLPRYVLLAEDGSPHTRSFQVAVEVAGARHPAAWGRTRKEAERFAAREALLRVAATPATDGDAVR